MTKRKFKKSFQECKKPGFCTLETKVIEGREYHNIEHFHFEVCKDCNESCNGRVNYEVIGRAFSVVSGFYQSKKEEK